VQLTTVGASRVTCEVPGKIRGDTFEREENQSLIYFPPIHVDPRKLRVEVESVLQCCSAICTISSASWIPTLTNRPTDMSFMPSLLRLSVPSCTAVLLSHLV